MTTFFYGSPEIQAAAPPPEGIQTLHLMNPNYLSYSDTPPPPQGSQQQTSNMLFFNPPSHAPPQNHHLLGVPLPLVHPSRSSSHHGIGILNFQNNMWGSLDQSSAGTVSTVVSVGAQDVRSQSQQGLSLSLSSRQRFIGEGEHEIQQHGHGGGGLGGDDMKVSRELSPPSVSVASNGIFGSKYLKVVQELLDEVVNIGKVGNIEKMKMSNESMAKDGSTGVGGGGGDGKRLQELTTAQKQELQMKKAKLVSMIDEVEQRYRQYHHQMQLVVSSFEQAAGIGSAKSYTALALQTISKQFKCLKDAISSQIKATNESLGDEACSGVNKIEGSRLKYVDHHLRQQRAIQQLGMMQHNPWRPQRGLPEIAVSVLRAWLFEHFLHPYPKDSDKVILAKQTGLTRSQVSNWFINARVRLWKPMVEEMYLEEMKEQDKNKNGSANHANNEHNKAGSTSHIAPQEISLGAKARQSEPERLKNYSQNPSEFPNSFTNLKNRRSRDDAMQNAPSSYSLLTNATDHVGGGGGFDAYFSPVPLAPKFKGNGNVSISLGLGENLSFSASEHDFMSGDQNIQLGRLDMGIPSGTEFCGINNNSQNSHSRRAGLEDIEVQNRKRFVAQLLPDFMA